jgi:NAD+ diphosphatase
MDIIQGLPLARFTVDRAAHLRASASWLDDVLSNDQTRAVLVHDGQVAVTDALSLHLVKSESLSSLSNLRDRAFLLGADEDHTFIGVRVDDRDDSVVLWASMRDIGATMSAQDVGLAITATALASWHWSHEFCPQCGHRTDVVEAGWARRCPIDNRQHFPRTEPAVIVAVEDHDGRLLLGRRTNWAEGWYSILAGFVEAGESSESAVLREIREESGVELDATSLKYLGSQPWPFPASLMMAYRATATTVDLVPDGDEIAELRWVSASELRDACQAGLMKLPNRTSIAWHVIEHWFGQPLLNEWSRG